MYPNINILFITIILDYTASLELAITYKLPLTIYI